MAKGSKTEKSIEELRAQWETIRHGPFGPRWRFVHRAIASSVLTPAEMSAEVQLLAKAKRRLEALCSNERAFDEVWERGGEFYQRTPCHCGKCRGKRKWPSYYIVAGVSLECLIDQHADDRPRSILEVGYTIPRGGCYVLGTSAEIAGMCGALDTDAKKHKDRPLCEACQENRRARRQRYCSGCLKQVTTALKDAGWPPKQLKNYLSPSHAFGSQAADYACAG